MRTVNGNGPVNWNNVDFRRLSVLGNLHDMTFYENENILLQELNKAPGATSQPVYDALGREITGMRWITRQYPGEELKDLNPNITYYRASPQYQIIDNKMIQELTLEGIRRTNAKFRASFSYPNRGGRAKTTILFEPDNFDVELLKRYNEPFAFGASFTNSYDGSAAFRGESFGVSMICINLNLWGEIFDSINVRHIGKAIQDKNSLPAEVERFTNNLINTYNDRWPNFFEVAAQTELEPEILSHIPEIMVGTGVSSERGSMTIARNFEYLSTYSPDSPRQNKGRPTYLDLGNAATAYLTHFQKNNDQWTSQHIEKAAILWQPKGVKKALEIGIVKLEDPDTGKRKKIATPTLVPRRKKKITFPQQQQPTKVTVTTERPILKHPLFHE